MDSERNATAAEQRHLQARIAELETMLSEPLDADTYDDIATELHDSCNRLQALTETRT